VTCELARNCSLIRCPVYTYTRLNPPEDSAAASPLKADDPQGLYRRLQRVPYSGKHEGIVKSVDAYHYEEFCTDFHEAENVSRAHAAWAAGFNLPRPYLWKHNSDGTRAAPGTGLRSAVPLGGIGAGSFEVRADGSFHEWTIENASPASQAKLSPAALRDALFGVRVVETGNEQVFAKALRTSPPAGIKGIESLAYSGLFPMSKLRLDDAALPVEAELSMLSSFRIYDINASNSPSASFALSVHNPGSAAVKVALLLTLPFGENLETDRGGSDMANATVTSATACLEHCAGTKGCLAWSFNMGKSVCYLKDEVGPTVWYPGVISGSMHSWSRDASGGSSFSATRACSGPVDSQCGGINIGASGGSVSFRSASDVKTIWNDFETDGELGSKLDSTASHGALAVRATVPAGGNGTLLMTLGWYFPQRTWTGLSATNGTDEATAVEGNLYAAQAKSAAEVVTQAQSQLLPALDTIEALHSVLVTEPTWPAWVGENLVNSLSHSRNSQLNSRGEWSQFESFACNNVDSIHNDFQRSRFYLWFFAPTVKSKLRAWAHAQCGFGQTDRGHYPQCTAEDHGMLQEQLACGCAGPTMELRDGFGCGRRMGDVTTNWIHYLLGYVMQTGDSALATELHANVQAAARWMIRNAAADGLPNQLQMTYDQYGLQNNNHTSYNALLYLSAVKACVKLAEIQHVHDTSLATDCDTAFTRGSAAFSELFWSDENGYYRGVVDETTGSPPWIMGDSMFGTVSTAVFFFVALQNKSNKKLLPIDHGSGAWAGRAVCQQHCADAIAPRG
jgi:non-lysosomal glucosylceramidase